MSIMFVIIFAILFICIVCVLGVVIWGIIDNHRINKMFKDYTVISEAIFLYRMNCIDNGDIPLVNYSDMNPVKTVMDRWAYKGYRSILDPKKLFIIEKYIPIVLSYINEKNIDIDSDTATGRALEYLMDSYKKENEQ